MNSNEHYLEEYNVTEERDHWSRPLILFVSFMILLFLFETILIDFSTFTARKEDDKNWPMFGFAVVFPFFGLLLFIWKKRLGWIIIAWFVYMMLFALVLFMGSAVYNGRVGGAALPAGRQFYAYAMILVIALSSIAILTKAIRTRFRIKNWVMTLTLFASGAFALLLFIAAK